MKYFLIAENNLILNKYVQRLLKNRYIDAVVHSAYNGEEALEKARMFDYSALLSEITLPKLDGFQLYQRLAEESPSMASRMGFVSSLDYGIQVKGLQQEELPIITKPFTPDELYNLVDGILISGAETPEEKRANDIERKHERRIVNKNGSLKPLNLDSVNRITGKIIDISDGGFGFQYENGMFPCGFQAKVVSMPLDILNKKAEMVWANDDNGNVKAGFQWI